MSFIKDLRWEIKMFFYKMSIKKDELKKSSCRKKHCHFGIHKIRWKSLRYTCNGEVLYNLTYIGCAWCDYKFFANKKDLATYQDYLKIKKIQDTELLNQLIQHSAKETVLLEDSGFTL